MEVWRRIDTEREGEEEEGRLTCKKCTLKKEQHAEFAWSFSGGQILLYDGRKQIENSTLVALTIIIAESQAEEKEMMVSVVVNCV